MSDHDVHLEHQLVGSQTNKGTLPSKNAIRLAPSSRQPANSRLE